MTQAKAKPLKIAVLIRNFVTTGGAERYAVEVTRRLAQKHEVTVLCQEVDLSCCDGIKVEYIPKWMEKPRWLNQILFSIFCHRRLKTLDIDVIHSHDRTHHYDALVTHCPCYKSKSVDRGPLSVFFYHLKRCFSLRQAVYAWLEAQQFKSHAQRVVVVVSDYIARDIKKCYPSQGFKTVVAPPGVEQTQERCEIYTKDRPLKVLFVGSEFKRKGLEAAIRGFAKAVTQQKDLQKATLSVAGGGDPTFYQQLCRSLGVEEQVHFLGLVKDVNALYKSHHLFLFPTLIEPFGMSPLEAMSFGLPVIISSKEFNGAAEQFSKEEAWVLEDPESETEIATALESICDEKRWLYYSQQSLQVSQRLTWDHCAEQNEKALLLSQKL